MSTYSFQDVNASMIGPGAQIDLGYGSAVSEEGITITMANDRNVVKMGADGEGMHSLRAAKNGSISVRLLKTSPVNQQLAAIYNAQSQSSALWGKNVITVRQNAAGDLVTAREVAITKMPDLNYAQDGDMVEWQFQAIKIDPFLGEY